MTNANITDFLQTNKDRLNVSKIARDAGMPESTLRMVVNDHRPLPSKYEESLTSVVNDIRSDLTC